MTGQIPVSQTNRHLLTISNLSLGPGAQGEEGRPFSMSRPEDVLGRPVHTMTKGYAVESKVFNPNSLNR